MKTLKHGKPSAFTLVEVLITINIVAIVGGMVYLALNSGLTLYAKNTAVNSAHEQARSGVDQMLTSIHASVSIPQLVNTTLTPIAQPGTGPAAGLDYQRFVTLKDAGGNSQQRFKIAANADSTDTTLSVTMGSFVPPASLVGVRFNIPSHKIEQDIVSISAASGGVRTITFANAIGSDVIVVADGSGNGNGNGNGTSYISGFFTCRGSYVVVDNGQRYNGQPYYDLRSYPTNDLGPLGDGIRNGVQTYKTIARNITSPTPFSILLNASGGVDVRSVAAVQLSTAEPQFSNRGYAAVNMFINSYIPFRSQLTVFQ